MAATYTGASYLGGSGSKMIPLYWSDFVRSNLYTSMYMRQLGTKVTIPRGMGDAVKIPRWKSVFKTLSGRTKISAAKLSAAFTNVSGIAEVLNNTTVIPQALCAEFISGSVKQFAGARGYNDKIVIVSYADFIEGALESLTKELAFRLETHTRTNISANSNLIMPVGATAGKAKSTDVINGKSIAQVPAIFDSQNVPRWDDDTHVALVHPLVQYDIYRDISANGWLNIAQYGDPERIYRGEIGQMYGVRFLVSGAMPVLCPGTASTTGSTTFAISGNATGSNAYFFAPDSFYSLELEDGGIEVIHHELGSAGATDPTNNIGTIGCKCFYGALGAPKGDYKLLRMAHGLTLGIGSATF